MRHSGLGERVQGFGVFLRSRGRDDEGRGRKGELCTWGGGKGFA